MDTASSVDLLVLTAVVWVQAGRDVSSDVLENQRCLFYSWKPFHSLDQWFIKYLVYFPV